MDDSNAYHAGSEAQQESIDREQHEAYARVMERILRHVPRVRLLVPVLESDIARSQSQMDSMGIQPGGAHGDKTQSRGVRMSGDHTLNTMRKRLEQIDAIYAASLNEDLRQFLKTAFWKKDATLEKVKSALHISERTYWRYRQYVLEAYIDGLPDRGWLDELEWWGGITLDMLVGRYL